MPCSQSLRTLPVQRQRVIHDARISPNLVGYSLVESPAAATKPLMIALF